MKRLNRWMLLKPLAQFFSGNRHLSPITRSPKLELVRLEDRTVPTVVTVSSSLQTLSEGGSAGLWLYRSGGDTAQSLTVNVGIGADGQGDPLAA